MDDRAEVHGSGGVAYADLLHRNAIETFSASGYDYAVEKAATTVGWSFTMYEELWNYGFPQEFTHFVDCVQNDKQPIETGQDGRAVLETLFAAKPVGIGTGIKGTLQFTTDAGKPWDFSRSGGDPPDNRLLGSAPRQSASFPISISSQRNPGRSSGSASLKSFGWGTKMAAPGRYQ
jgi:hypothetical protein